MAAVESQVVLRASATMYALFGGIMGAVFILAAFVAIAKEPAFWFPTAVMGVILSGILLWLATTTLMLAGDAIHYRSLLVAKDVPLSDIVKAQFIAGFSSFKPHQRLVLTVREQHGDGEITINLGLFDRAEIKRWVDTLNARLS
jgi:hypothetical protein